MQKKMLFSKYRNMEAKEFMEDSYLQQPVHANYAQRKHIS